MVRVDDELLKELTLLVYGMNARQIAEEVMRKVNNLE